jgi:hypothetical protein
MQERDSRIERTHLQLLVFIGHTEILAIESESQCSFIHVQEDAKHALPLEDLAVLRSI